MTSFQYEKLNDFTAEIRLLRLLSDKAESQPIECKLYHFRLDKSYPKFAAISYAWGSSTATKEIRLNSTSFSVRENVWELLLQLRSSGIKKRKQPLFFWIDGVCINQDDTQERNHQVKLMRDIYSSAKVVLVWLGVAADMSDQAMDYLQQLSSCRLGQTKRRVTGQVRIRNPHAKSAREIPEIPETTYFGDPGVEHSFRPRVSDAVLDLFHRTYWTRIWIIQEVILASEALILCGSKRVPWSKLNNLFGTLEYHWTNNPGRFYKDKWNRDAVPSHTYNLVRAKEHFEENPKEKATGIPLSTLMETFRSSECSEIHDKVYGLLALSCDAIEVDYQKPIKDVYDDVVSHVRRADQTGNVAETNALIERLASSLGISTAACRSSAGSDGFQSALPQGEQNVRWRPFWEKDMVSFAPSSLRRPHSQSNFSQSNFISSSAAFSSTSRLSDHYKFVSNLSYAESNSSSAPSSPSTDNENSEEVSNDISRPGSPKHGEHAEDDTAVSRRPSRQVDYLSHEWREEDIWSSWRYIVTRRGEFPNSARLENASWRTWMKAKNNLKTISPESLNWLKDCDVTWLYGPLQSGQKALHSTHTEPSSVSLSKTDSLVNLNKKPILKKRSMSEVMLQRSLSTASPLNQATAAVKAQETRGILRPHLGRSTTDYLAYPFSSRRLSGESSSVAPSTESSGITSPNSERKHIHFNEQVEQCIAVEVKGDDDDDDDMDTDRYGDDSDSDDSVMMKRMKTKKRPLSRRKTMKSKPAEGKTIAMLPSTTLKYREDTPTAMKHSRSPLMSPSSHGTLRSAKQSVKIRSISNQSWASGCELARVFQRELI